MKDRIKIAVALVDYKIHDWELDVFTSLTNSDYAEITAIINYESDSISKNEIKKNGLYNLYTKFDQSRHRPLTYAFTEKDVREFTQVEIFNSNRLSKDVNSIKSSDEQGLLNADSFDLILNFGEAILAKDAINIPSCGIWHFLFSDNLNIRGNPKSFWEVVEDRDESGIVLQLYKSNLNEPVTVLRSFSTTEKLSVLKNLNNLGWKAASLLPLKISELYHRGEDLFFQDLNDKNVNPVFFDKPIRDYPTTLEMLPVIWNKIKSIFTNKLNKARYVGQWMMLFKISENGKLATSFDDFIEIIPPKDRFWADPFIIFKNDRYYIFLEELIYKENVGFISVIEMDETGNYSEPEIVLKKDYHLSYPFLIEDNDELYMIPETMDNGTIELYKCIDFPLEWELDTVLMENIKAVDSTIIFHNGLYWLFANVIFHKEVTASDELCLYYSDELNSTNWTPHPLNPIVSDVKNSRPAGKIFRHNDNLYRPAQNCSKRYGYGMKINVIEKLTKNDYQERVVDSIFPNWDKNIIGTHTLNKEKNLTIIDGFLKRKK